jgi:hypothetical protein
MSEKITSFDDKANLRRLSDAMREALAPVAERFGVEVFIGGGSYSPSEGTFKPKVEVRTADSEELTFRNGAPLLWPRGLEADDYGRTFSQGGRTFKLASVNLRARKRPVLADSDDGKRYAFSTDSVLKALGREVA